MFIVYHSNQPEFFKKLIMDIMFSRPLKDPIQSEVILVENDAVSQWIQLELSNRFGIAANIEFTSLFSFVHKVINKITSENCMTSYFVDSFMYWKFMEILSQIYLLEKFDFIKKYLCNDFNQRKCGQLSQKLVVLFSQYLIYRSDWLHCWESNRMVDGLDVFHQSWQSEIWRIFLKNMKNHSINFHNNICYFDYCINLLKNIKKINLLPSRIFIFGVISIPPIYWKILNLLSFHLDIYLWFVSPFKGRDDRNYFLNKKIMLLATPLRQNLSSVYYRSCSSSFILSDMYVNEKVDGINHVNKYNYFLLDSWRKFGKDILITLSHLKGIYEVKNFTVSNNGSMLNILQKKILEFQKIKTKIENPFYCVNDDKDQRHILQLKDQSVTFHICHSAQREIEVLHDNLLLMLKEDPSLLKKGIVVMAPDIYHYFGAIHAVFNNIDGRDLPFVISNYHKKFIHPIISSFLNLLQIAHSRCTSEEILSFLTIPSIAARFNITEEDMKLLFRWTDESGIRWGMDNIYMNNLTIPIVHQNTWYFGFTRMLLGYIMGSQKNTWLNFFPYSDIDEEHIKIIGKLGEFLNTLRKWRNKLRHSQNLKKWANFCQEILSDFFYCSYLDIKENKVLFFIKNCWKDIIEAGVKSGYAESVNIIVFLDKLNFRLNQDITSNHQFLPNVVNFCDITSICYIPCKVVCFLGMNNDCFPRSKRFLDFDLIQKLPRYGDNDLYDKDCYAFLLAFLLAQEKVYISFIGYVIHDNNARLPSILVNELLEYIALNFYLAGDKNLEVSINIKRIRNHLYQWYSHMPFTTKNFIFGRKEQSFSNEWLSAANINMHIRPFFSFNFFATALSSIKINTISFCDLYNFYRHPIRTWFQKRLGVYFNQSIFKKLSNDEPFLLSKLTQLNINTQLIDCLINDGNTNNLYHIFRASGMLPYGGCGKLHWIKQLQDMTLLSKKIKMFDLSKKFDVDISLMINNIALTGQLTTVQKNGLVRWKTTEYLSIKDILLLWLEHVVFCSMGGVGDSRLFSVNSTWHFPCLSKLEAERLLSLLISGYCIGMNAPLLLLYRLGEVWMRQVFDWKNRTISILEFSAQKKIYQDLSKVWQYTYASSIKEYSDPYLYKVIPFYLTEKDILKITKTAETYLFHPMKYRVLLK